MWGRNSSKVWQKLDPDLLSRASINVLENRVGEFRRGLSYGVAAERAKNPEITASVWYLHQSRCPAGAGGVQEPSRGIRMKQRFYYLSKSAPALWTVDLRQVGLAAAHLDHLPRCSPSKRGGAQA